MRRHRHCRTVGSNVADSEIECIVNRGFLGRNDFDHRHIGINLRLCIDAHGAGVVRGFRSQLPAFRRPFAGYTTDTDDILQRKRRGLLPPRNHVFVDVGRPILADVVIPRLIDHRIEISHRRIGRFESHVDSRGGEIRRRNGDRTIDLRPRLDGQRSERFHDHVGSRISFGIDSIGVDHIVALRRKARRMERLFALIGIPRDKLGERLLFGGGMFGEDRLVLRCDLLRIEPFGEIHRGDIHPLLFGIDRYPRIAHRNIGDLNQEGKITLLHHRDLHGFGAVITKRHRGRAGIGKEILFEACRHGFVADGQLLHPCVVALSREAFSLDGVLHFVIDRDRAAFRRYGSRRRRLDHRGVRGGGINGSSVLSSPQPVRGSSARQKAVAAKRFIRFFIRAQRLRVILKNRNSDVQK